MRSRASLKSNMNLESLLEIEFAVCDPHKPPDRSVVVKAYKSLFGIIAKFVAQMPEYKVLKRYEPAFSTLDEKKQLRCYGLVGYEYDTSLGGIKGTLRFSQRHCEEGSYFKLNELATIAEFMRYEIEKVMGYGIFSSIVMHPIDTEE